MTTSSITAALPGTASSTSRGQSCPSACAIGHIGPDQRDLVLVDLRILPARSVTICEEVASEVIRLMVGTRPATAELHSSIFQKAPPSRPAASEVRNGIHDSGYVP